MYSLIKHRTIYLILICLISSFYVVADAELSSMEFEQEIYKEPYLTYQNLVKSPRAPEDNDYLYWLLRKSQCEYLLYFYDEFEKTIKTTQSYVNENSPLLIQSHMNFYQGIIYRDKGEYNKSSYYLDLVLDL